MYLIISVTDYICYMNAQEQNSQKFEWIIFDADHTLFDFDRSAEESITETFSEHGYKVDPSIFEVYHKINIAAWREYENGNIDRERLRTIRFEQLFAHLEVKFDPSTFHDSYLSKLPNFPYFLDYAEELLEIVFPRFKTGIVTNGMPEVQRPRLKKVGLHDTFDFVLVAGEIGHAKPNALFFDAAFELMEQPDKHNVLIVGDSLNSDIRGGAEYGIKTCWYNPKSKEADIPITPDFEIQHLSELHKIIF